MIELRWIERETVTRDRPYGAYITVSAIERVLQYRVLGKIFRHDGSEDRHNPNAHWSSWKDVPVVTEP